MYTGGGGGDVALLRGAIFFVGMSLWGNQRVDHLDSYSPMTILPTFLQASLACTHHLVLYEITLQTERLVTKVLGLHRSSNNSDFNKFAFIALSLDQPCGPRVATLSWLC